MNTQTCKTYALFALAVLTGSYLFDFDTFKNMLTLCYHGNRMILRG
jgi:hypothetical protein